ncbi:hypothetical protein D910_00739, partial [Dendroctonus ponderosae]
MEAHSSGCMEVWVKAMAYRYDESPWQTSRRRDGHLLRLWAEVFYATAASEAKGQFFWQQLSDDLVPVNITCIQDSPEYVFHITAYNSQVDRIVDVRMVQPGTRIGTANECFIYWRDPITNDTWGLNFTSSIDCKQFRECVFPAFKFSRKASSSYSLKLDPPTKHKLKAKRKPLSTPASPSRGPREPQCTCMTAEQMAKLRAQDPRYRGSSTLPRAAKISDTEGKIATAASSTSLYDNLGATQTSSLPGKAWNGKGFAHKNKNVAGTKSGHRNGSQTKQSRNVQSQSDSSGAAPASAGAPQAPKTVTASVGTENDTETQGNQTESQSQTSDQQQSESVQVGEPLAKATSSGKPSLKEKGHHMLSSAKSVDYSDMEMNRNREFRGGHGHNSVSNNIQSRKNKSKSSEDMNRQVAPGEPSHFSGDEQEALPLPQSSRQACEQLASFRPGGPRVFHQLPIFWITVVARNRPRISRPRSLPGARKGRGRRLFASIRQRDLRQPVLRDHAQFQQRQLRHGAGGAALWKAPPPPPGSNTCTAPGNSTANSMESCCRTPASTPLPARPPVAYSWSMRCICATPWPKAWTRRATAYTPLRRCSRKAWKILSSPRVSPGPTPEAHITRGKVTGPTSSASMRSSTLPYNQRMGVRERERDGYYSDRNELSREREKERERGYLSDHNAKCASCIGESSRAQWFRHSDGWRSGSSAYGSAQGG